VYWVAATASRVRTQARPTQSDQAGSDHRGGHEQAGDEVRRCGHQGHDGRDSSHDSEADDDPVVIGMPTGGNGTGDNRAEHEHEGELSERRLPIPGSEPGQDDALGPSRQEADFCGRR